MNTAPLLCKTLDTYWWEAFAQRGFGHSNLCDLSIKRRETFEIKTKVIYSDAVNDQGPVVKRLHSEGAEQWFSIPEPAEEGAGVSMDRTVENSRAPLGDCLRHVGFTLQHWRLWRHTAHIYEIIKVAWMALTELWQTAHLWYGRMRALGWSPRCSLLCTRRSQHHSSSRSRWPRSSCRPHLQWNLNIFKVEWTVGLNSPMIYSDTASPRQ